jgi:hypothetical protein
MSSLRETAITTDDFPASCPSCLDRGGERVAPGDRVICSVDHGCSGTVDRLEDDDQLVVVRTTDGKEAWVPHQELVPV